MKRAFKGTYRVGYPAAARDDLLRLFDFLLESVRTHEDFDAAQLAIDTIRDTVERSLGLSPFMVRKASESPFFRELLISFRGGGYVALYEFEDASRVTCWPYAINWKTITTSETVRVRRIAASR